MPVGLHHLRYFVAVAEERNITRAASRLRVAQPSLSAQIKYLERHLGVVLFRRHPRGVELTLAGALFLAEAAATLQSADAAVGVARMAARGEAGQLRIGVILGIQIELTSRILRAFREAHPGVRIEFAEHTFADPSAGLNARDVDLAFVMPPITHRGLNFLEILRTPRAAIISDRHPLADRAEISVTELFDDPWIYLDSDDAVCRDFWLAMEYRDRPPRLAQPIRSLDSFIQLAMAGEAVGLAVAWAEQAFGRPGIRFVPVNDVAPATNAVAWPSNPANPLVERFVEVARTVS